jgi:tyrosine decarboxylase/aspartate 1-decarboxylase
LGTRPGASAAAAYAVFHYLDYEGYAKQAKACMATTSFLTTQLEANHIDFVPPELNIVAIKVDRPRDIALKLAELNWFVGIDTMHNILRVVCMPHVSSGIIVKFIDDLQKVIP